MKRLLKSSTANVRKVLMRDPHAPNTVHVQTTTNTAPVIEQNKRIRNAQLMKRGQRFTSVDAHAELTAQFQFPTATDYQLARETYPDIFADLDEGGETAIRAGERLSLLMPEYVTMVKPRNTVAVGG